jgi:hypothetical protein
MNESAEWIVPFQGRNVSLGTQLNFLWRRNNVFIMDNHLAAAWCWIQSSLSQDRHRVLHVDAHFDAAAIDESVVSGLPNLRGAGFQEYRGCAIKGGGASIPVFRWDNYISIYEQLFGGFVQEWVFSTHGIGSVPAFKTTEVSPSDLVGYLDDAAADKPWILNLDLDYFRSVDGDRFPEDQRQPLIEGFRDLAERASGSILTIALSPECCGSWESAESLLAEVCDGFDLDFALPAA